VIEFADYAVAPGAMAFGDTAEPLQQLPHLRLLHGIHGKRSGKRTQTIIVYRETLPLSSDVAIKLKKMYIIYCLCVF